MDVRSFWGQLSIRRKTLVWLLTLILVLLSMMGISGAARARTTAELTRLQENDTRCYAVQAALNEERDAFEQYARTRSHTDRQRYEAACAALESALAALPEDHASLGEDRIARTWNLKNGYEGYREFRDRVVSMDPADPEYTHLYYRVLGMLDDLSIYALRLGLATLEQGGQIYSRTLQDYEALPALSIFLP